MFFKLFVVGITLFFVMTGAFAQFTGPGTTGEGKVTVKEILDRPVDDMWVILKGKILRKVGDEKYLFTDGTGQITVEIDDEYFPYDKPITPETTVEISGEVDCGFIQSIEIDVKQIIISDASTTPPKGGFKSN